MRALVVVPLAVLLAAAVSAEGPSDRYWPQWRGPAMTGVAPEASPPVEWGEAKNLRWKVEVPGKGQSSPIVWGDRVFLTTAISTETPIGDEASQKAEAAVPQWMKGSAIRPEKTLRFVVLAFERSSGRVLWRRQVREAPPHEGTHAHGSWASPSPATDGEVLVAHFGSHGTYAFDLEGNLLWSVDLGDMTTRNSFGEGSSPTIHGDTVIVNWDHEGPSFLVALDRRTGQVRWKAQRDEVTSWSTPIVVTHAGRPQVVVNATGRTRGYDLEKGEVLWEAGGMTVNVIPSPVHSEGRIFVASGFRQSALQAIDLAAARGDVLQSGAMLWSRDRDTPYVPSLLVYRGRLYFFKVNQAVLSVVDARSGEPVYEPQRLAGVDGVYASPVAADGRVYVVGRNGVAYVLEDGTEFKVLAQNRLDDAFDASPAVAGGEIFLRGKKHLYCLAKDAAAESGPEAGPRGHRQAASAG